MLWQELNFNDFVMAIGAKVTVHFDARIEEDGSEEEEEVVDEETLIKPKDAIVVAEAAIVVYNLLLSCSFLFLSRIGGLEEVKKWWCLLCG